MSIATCRQAGESGILISESVRRFRRAHPDLASSAARQAGNRHWREVADLGWLMLPFSTIDGGLHDRSEAASWSIATLFEGLGHELLSEPLAEAALLAGGLLAAVPESQIRSAMIGELIAGRSFFAAALEEARPEGGPAGFTRAVHEQEGWRIDGQKAMVLGAPAADTLIVLANIHGESTAGEPETALFAIDRGGPGIELQPYRLRDGHWAADVTFHGTRVQEERLLTRGDAARMASEFAIDSFRFGVAAEIVGIAERATSMARDYVVQREQFGRPVSSYQVIEHRLVDMRLKVEQLRSLVVAAAAAIEALGISNAQAEIALAYRGAGIWGVEVVQASIQLHGGMGMTEELGLGRALCRTFSARLHLA